VDFLRTGVRCGLFAGSRGCVFRDRKLLVYEWMYRRDLFGRGCESATVGL